MGQISDQPTQYPHGWSAALGRAALAGFMSCCAVAAIAADPPAATTVDDGVVTLRAKKALWDNAALSKLTVGVRVRQGVATLHGPVPHAAIAEHAVSCVRGVAGVREVINELHVVAADTPLAKASKEPVTARRSAATRDDSPAPRPTGDSNTVRPESTQATVSPVTPPATPAPLIEQIAQLRDRDRRFSGIRIEVRGGQVILRGRVDQSQDAWEFARTVRTVAGVIGVTNSITTAP